MELLFPQGEEEAAELVEGAVGRSLAVVEGLWGLREGRGCRVYVATGWFGVVVHSMPWYLLPAGLLALPFWGPRMRRLWPAAGGWMLRFGGRAAVFVKPPRLMGQADRTVGKLLFFEEPDARRKVEQVTCHELTHALAAHLQLPAWLNEGIAMLAVDAYVGRPTVRPESLELLPGGGEGRAPRGYRRLLGMKLLAIAGQYARAYWVTRLLAERHGELLRAILARRRSRGWIEREVAGALGLRRRELWKRVDEVVGRHFAEGTKAPGA
jgi:hypothetical protein